MAPLRVVIVQPSLAKYRVPVYRELAARPGIDLRVWYGDEPGIGAAEPDGFAAAEKPMTIRHVLGQEVRWHAAQLQAVGLDDADVVLLSWSSRYLSLLPALAKARRRGMPTVLWGHGYSKGETPTRRFVRDLFGKRATALLFYDRATADRAIADGWPEDRVYVAPNAIDQSPITAAIDQWRTPPDRLQAFAEEHDLKDAEPVVFLSRLLPENRADLLIEAVAKLKDKRSNLVALIVGDGPARGDLEQLAQRLGVADRVRMPGAIFDDTQLAPWMLMSRLFVYPANIGLSLLHAFGYGLPVITSQDLAAQNPEIVALVDGKNGKLVPPDDADAVAEAIDTLLSDPQRLAAMSAEAATTVRERFSLTAMVDGMQAALRAAAGIDS
ncbi:MAG: glycosyltransferase family 4 protein [Planctomycetota bacterium]